MSDQTTVYLRDLKAGDVVVAGTYGATHGEVDRVEPARARGYVVVTFKDRKQTSGHGLMEVQVAGRLCPQCGAPREPQNVTCLRSECQEAGTYANRARYLKGPRRSRSAR